jgi:hypothetical protein
MEPFKPISIIYKQVAPPELLKYFDNGFFTPEEYPVSRNPIFRLGSIGASFNVYHVLIYCANYYGSFWYVQRNQIIVRQCKLRFYSIVSSILFPQCVPFINQLQLCI